MILLAVDATGEELSVALQVGDRIISARRGAGPGHDESLLPAVASVLRRAKCGWEDLEAVAAAAGPGRFTGIRVGMAFAAVVAMKLRIPALALSRLEAAAGRSREDLVLAALPGWKSEVYFQPFKGGRPTADAAWTAPEGWPRVQSAAEARGLVVSFHDAGAVDLLTVARKRLAVKDFPPFAPFYLKPAGYERPRR